MMNVRTLTLDATKRIEGGSRRWQSGVETDPDKPLITIITSTFNAARDLPWSINSIRGQTYPYIQWIVADGNSQDDTVKLLSENDDLIDVWFSEPDTGIYDAWNKALEYVKGEWVQFIGAGDELAFSNTLEQMAPHLSNAHPNYDIVYGRLAYISESSRTLIEEVGTPWEEMKNKWEGCRPKLPAHPAVFHHVSTFTTRPCFDTTYKIAADSQFLMRQLKHKEFLYIPILIDRMPLGGISSKTKSFAQAINESYRASIELGFKLPITHLIYEKVKYTLKTAIVLALDEQGSQRVFDAFRGVIGKRKKWSIK